MNWRRLLVFGGVAGETDLDQTSRFAFGTGYELDVAGPSFDRGVVLRSPNQGCYDPGTSVTLTAVPAPGYKFSGWQGDLTGTNKAVSVIMDRHHFVGARFAASTTATLVQQFVATPAAGGIEIRWRVGGEGIVRDASIRSAPRRGSTSCDCVRPTAR